MLTLPKTTSIKKNQNGPSKKKLVGGKTHNFNQKIVNTKVWADTYLRRYEPQKFGHGNGSILVCKLSID